MVISIGLAKGSGCAMIKGEVEGRRYVTVSSGMALTVVTGLLTDSIT